MQMGAGRHTAATHRSYLLALNRRLSLLHQNGLQMGVQTLRIVFMLQNNVVAVALVFALSAALNRLSLSVATLLFVVYSVLNGVMFSSIFLVYTMSSVANVFFITAGTFAAMAAYGYFTKSDLTTLSKYLFMALIGLLIATVVNIFVGSSMLSLVISYAGVLIFVGLTAYDSQKIKQMLAQQVDADETAQKIALFGALTLYLDFINLFLYLLRLLGNRR